ncbi:UNVERIFIED_CONTAM: Secreted RxLR effector protein [Sesamum latifolium]|uniref:Secreted RxLR effector protein n=1 Tax=Sesamum latifolium TaxID=2727402 RepID=A0AAW2XBR1_9LAMI
MGSMSSNKVWTLVHPSRGVKPVGVNGSTNISLELTGRLLPSRSGLWRKVILIDLGLILRKSIRPKSIRIMLAIAACRRVSHLLGEQKVCHLQRSIYGLKQASRSRNIHFDEIIRGYDFIKNNFDPCVYKKVSGSSVAFLMLYVDDILLIGNDVKMLGDTKKVLKRFKMENSKRGFLPVRHGVKLSKKQSPKTDEELRKMFDILYTSAVRSIHSGELILEGYNDASFQSYEEDAKSQSGFVFKLNGGVVAWKSSKQDTTDDSTIKAEYIATSEAAKEVVWIKNYIQELGVVPNIAEPVVIFCDNNGAIAQAKEPRSHHRSKHILRRYHLLRDMVERGDVRMDRVTSAENMTDPLTKSVSQIAHAQHLGRMNFRNMSDWL